MSDPKAIVTRSPTVSVDATRTQIVKASAELENRVSKEQAAKAVTIIVACCLKRADINEVEATIQIRQMCRLLENYPTCVIDELIDPLRGISGKQKFLPTVSELKEFADKIQWRRCDELGRSKRTIEQLQRREDPIDPQERERHVANATAARREIQATAQRMSLRW